MSNWPDQSEKRHRRTGFIICRLARVKNHIVYFMPMTKLVNFFNVTRIGNFSCDEQKGILLTCGVTCASSESVLSLRCKISHFQNSYSIYILKLNLRWLLSLQTCIEVVGAAEISKIWQSTAGTFADLHTKHCFNSWGNLNQRQSLYKYPFTILDNINCKWTHYNHELYSLFAIKPPVHTNFSQWSDCLIKLYIQAYLLTSRICQRSCVRIACHRSFLFG